MNYRMINKAFKEEWENTSLVNIDADKKILENKLDYIINQSDNSVDLVTYAKYFQDCIEEVFPDKPWWESVGLDIELDLFNTQDLRLTKDHILNSIILESTDKIKTKVVDENCKDSELIEDTVKKSNGKWTNRGDDGEEHGEFNTKKEADAQRRAMYANGYKESFSGNRRLDILLDTIDDSFPEIDSDMFRENLIVDEDEIDRRIEEINAVCAEYKQKVENYLRSNVHNIMKLTPDQFTKLQRYVELAGTRTASNIKNATQSAKRRFLAADINELKNSISSQWNFKYIEKLIGK